MFPIEAFFAHQIYWGEMFSCKGSPRQKLSFPRKLQRSRKTKQLEIHVMLLEYKPPLGGKAVSNVNGKSSGHSVQHLCSCRQGAAQVITTAGCAVLGPYRALAGWCSHKLMFERELPVPGNFTFLCCFLMTLI